MKKITNKILLSLMVIILCSIYAVLPIYAQSENVKYVKSKNDGESYKTILNGEESNNDCPITTKIKYYLNGEEKTADQIKGQSGKVKIEITYTNNSAEQVNVNGENITMYTPYIVGSVMMLDNDKFTNTTISSGKIIDNGLDTIAVGIAMPGMQTNLGNTIEDISIPESITFEADVKDFELGNIYMYMDSNIFSESSLDFLDEFESMYNDMQTLKDASTALVNGTQELQSGVTTYTEKMEEFNSGLTKYTNGVSEVSTNYVKIDNGIQTLNVNSAKIATGSSQLNAGIKELQTKLSEMVTGITAIKQGTDAVCANLTKISESISQKAKELEDKTAPTSETSIKLYNDGVATTTQVYTLQAQKSALEASIAKVTDETVKAELQTEVNALNTTITTLSSKITTERADYQEAINDLKTSTQDGLTALKNGVDGLTAQAAKPAANGVTELYNSVTSEDFNTKIGQLTSGASQLASGASEFQAGTNQLSQGSTAMQNGINTLNTNSGTLQSAGTQLQDGSNTILSGTAQVAEGMAQFDSDGINKLYNLFNGDIKNAQTRLQKIVDMSKNSNSSKYKYIIKFDSIK